ncbi:MAG: gliding motility-associated C-terminal domain-containing protein, partial [Cyclobacteriaceae bacterium]
SLADGDQVSATVTPDPAYACGSVGAVNSNDVTISIPGSLNAAVTVSADQATICQGETVTFSATATDAGANPTYQWFINGVEDATSTSDTYTSATLNNGDEVFAVVTADPSATCVTNSPVTSNIVTITVSDNLNLSVSLSADQTDICEGEVVTLTAVVTDGGAVPTFEWLVNGVVNPAVTGDTYMTNGASDGDQITVRVTADPALTCINNSPVTATPVTFSVDPVPVVTEDGITDASACGSADGAISVSVAGGSGTYTYEWTGPAGFTSADEDIANLVAGNYELGVTDNSSGCSVTYTGTVGEPVGFTIAEDSVSPVTGCDTSDGSVSITINGGSGDFTFDWAGPEGFASSNEDLAGLTAGVYNLIVTDNVSGCQDFYSATIDNAIAFTITEDLVTAVSSCGAADGAIEITVTNGSGDYTFDWSGPNGFTTTSEDVAGLEAGDYSLNVTDNVTGCTDTYLATITSPDGFTITEGDITQVSACGVNDGAIEITVTDGSGDYTFEWTGPDDFTANSEDINGLAPGTYDLAVTDNVSGCIVTYTATIDDPVDFTILEDLVSQISACGLNDGAIEISVNGGSGVFSYEWTADNGFTSADQDIFSLAAGTYQLNIRDNMTGCTAFYTTTIAEPVDFTITEDVVTQISACGASDGAVEISVSGGSGVFSYEWTADNGFTSADQNISGLAAGTYSLSVRDNMTGCEASYSVSLADPNGISITEDNLTDASGCGTADGEIAVTVNGGSGDFTFAWTGPGGFMSSDEDLTNLSGGTYDLIVTDNNGGCTASYSAAIADPTNFTITEDAVTAISACGFADGAIELTVTSTNPVAVFNYEWEGPDGFTASTVDISGLAAGVYTLTVRELTEDCTDTYSVELTDPVDFTINEEAVTPISGCNTADGAIDISITGGSGVFSYEWTGPDSFTATEQDQNNLSAAGDYSVTVRDNMSGCRASATFTVNSVVEVSNPVVELVADRTIACQGETITFTATYSGAGDNPTFNWFVNGVETITAGGPEIQLNSLATGDQVSVTMNVDPAAACPSATEVSAGPVTVTVRSVGDPECGSVSIDCGLFTVTLENDRMVLPTCATNDDGVLAFAVQGGTAPYIFTLRNDDLGYLTSLPGTLESDGWARFSYPDLSAGSFTYTVQDASGAICSLPVTLRNATAVTAFATDFADAACYGENSGQARLHVELNTEGYAEYSFDGGTSWFSFVNMQLVDNLPPNGDYTILVRDNDTDRCPAEVAVSINSATPEIVLSQEIETVVPADCNPTVSVGEINIGTVSGGDGGPYTFTIDDSGAPVTVPADGIITGISRNDEVVVIYDGSGCRMEFPIDINVPGAIEAEVVELVVDECSGSDSRGIQVAIDPDRTDADGPFELVLNNADQTGEGTVYSIPSTNELEIRGLDKGVLYRWTVRSSAANSCSDDGDIRLTGGITAVAFEATEMCTFDGRASVLFSNFSGQFGSGANPLQIYVYEQTGVDPVFTFAKNAIILDDFEINSNQFAWEPGGYKIFITQQQGNCEVTSEPVFVTISNPLEAEIIETTISLPEEPTGTLTVEVSPTSGTPGYTASIYHSQPTFQDRVSSPILDQPLFVNPDGDYQLAFTDLYPGSYMVVVQDAKGCTYEMEDSLGYDDAVFVPNVFTPNGDGSNQVFYIRNLPPEGAGVAITNRWGRTVYQSDNYQNDWDGGDENEGVYYYEVKMPSGQIITGWVEIWRGPAY